MVYIRTCAELHTYIMYLLAQKTDIFYKNTMLFLFYHKFLVTLQRTQT